MASVLLVDDHPEALELYQRAFERFGFQTFATIDPREARDIIASEQPSLLIVDYDMPFINGMDLMRQIRQDPSSSALPIIMLTGNMQVQQEWDIDLADLLLLKPVSILTLVELAKRLISQNSPC